MSWCRSRTVILADQDVSIKASGSDPSDDRDYAAWVLHQVELIKAGRWSELDRDNLVDEIESLERTSFDELIAAVKCVVRQMLTWDVQEDERNRAWADRIEAYRGEVMQEVSESPSYFDRRHDVLAKAYHLARFEMSQEDKLPFRLFPEACPYGWDDILTRKHLPTQTPEPKFHCFKSRN